MYTGGEPLTFEQQVILSLKGFRKNKKITQTQLADSIGVSRDTIARMESGRARVYLGMVKDIADALDVHLQDLLQEKEDSQILPENVTPSVSGIVINYSNKDLSLRADSLVGEEPKQSPRHIPQPVQDTEGRGMSQTPARNLYLDEKAVDSYGEPMKDYILKHAHFWHWVPESDLFGLSISSVVDAALKQGREEDVAALFNMIGVKKAAGVFRSQIMRTRHGYPDMTMDYFIAYFNRHAPEYT